MYKLLGGANIFLKHHIVVYSKNITASTMWAGDIFSVQIPGSNYQFELCEKRGLLAYLSVLILGFLS
jgi:hypothetical protein